ncbi:FkbM family methyltransferase [Flavobacterium sp. GB2R13]|uniref:FkbM family methyltransferase n=1 Tax=Flavobacterium algoris TaxID=3398733 RepID=UPI003A8AB5EC
MIVKIYNLIKNSRRNISIAQHSQYDFKIKFTIFLTLTKMYFKSNFYKNKTEITQNIFGFKVSSYSYDSLIFLFKEVFISKDYFFQSDTNEPKIIDCGANIGMSVLYFKFIFPNCSIVAFEPNPRAFYLLKKNIEQNNLKNIEVYNLALSDAKGEIDFYTGNDEQILLASIIKERGGIHKIKMETDLLSSFFTDAVDLIKMDIEGSEKQVVKDLVLSHKIAISRLYIIEYHHKINNEKSSLSSFLTPFEMAGFDYNIKTSFRKNGCFQDILLYVYRDETIQ